MYRKEERNCLEEKDRTKVFHFNSLAEEISFSETYSTISSSLHSQGRWWARASGKVLRSRFPPFSTRVVKTFRRRCIFSISPHLYSLLVYTSTLTIAFVAPSSIRLLRTEFISRILRETFNRRPGIAGEILPSLHREIHRWNTYNYFPYRAKFARSNPSLPDFSAIIAVITGPPSRRTRERRQGKFGVGHDLSGVSPGSDKTTRTTSTYSVSLFR